MIIMNTCMEIITKQTLIKYKILYFLFEKSKYVLKNNVSVIYVLVLSRHSIGQINSRNFIAKNKDLVLLKSKLPF